jgi:hypothetical protein
MAWHFQFAVADGNPPRSEHFQNLGEVSKTSAFLSLHEFALIKTIQRPAIFRIAFQVVKKKHVRLLCTFQPAVMRHPGSVAQGPSSPPVLCVEMNLPLSRHVTTLRFLH